jgi:hypothetical protein
MICDLPQGSPVPKRHAHLLGLVAALLLARCQCNDPLQALPEVGDVDGYVCHPVLDALAAGAFVTGAGPYGDVTATTDKAGYFLLEGLLAGPQTLDVAGSDFTSQIEVTVVADEKTRAPDPPCLLIGTGIVTGRICASEDGIGTGEGYWLTGARVYITVGGTVYETTTDQNGSFTLNSVPAGSQTLHVEKGSFVAEAAIVVVEGQVTRVDQLCVAPSTSIAVVTGVFDAIQTVLAGMGLLVKDCLPAGMADCPSELHATGSVTLVKGMADYVGDPEVAYYITDFLDNEPLLGQYDIVFFNCGLADEYFYSAPDTAKRNLASFVNNGGSIYVSDRAYEVIRISFPGIVGFAGPGDPSAWGSDRQRAWVGVKMQSLDAAITDLSLAQAVGAPSISIVYNKAGWVPLDTASKQPAGVFTWLKAAQVPVDSDRDGAADRTLMDDPLLVTVPYGQGRVTYTTFHNHEQATAQMRAVLQYLVFEL